MGEMEKKASSISLSPSLPSSGAGAGRATCSTNLTPTQPTTDRLVLSGPKIPHIPHDIHCRLCFLMIAQGGENQKNSLARSTGNTDF